MNRVKVSEATGPVLDWMVSTALGISPFSDGISWIVYSHNSKAFRQLPNYSTDWAQGGPIIERLMLQDGLVLRCWVERSQCQSSLDFPYKFSNGPTPLVAAMRCFVASKLGDDVEVPEELNHG